MVNKVKITIIEDDQDLVEITERFLTARGFEVSCADNGKKGLEVVDKIKPDLIILDVRMPDMGGKEVLTRLKKNKETKKIPVLMFTGKDDQADRIEALRLGAYEYVTKPYDGYLLMRQITNILHKKTKGEL